MILTRLGAGLRVGRCIGGSFGKPSDRLRISSVRAGCPCNAPANTLAQANQGLVGCSERNCLSLLSHLTSIISKLLDMAHNSPEEKEKGEILAKKLEQLLALARDPDLQQKIMKSVNDMSDFVKMAHEKAQYAELEAHEVEALAEVEKQMPILLQFVQDCQLAVGNQLRLSADSYYFHVKHLAEQGDATAKEVYERLRPLYRDMLKDSMEGMGLN